MANWIKGDSSVAAPILAFDISWNTISTAPHWTLAYNMKIRIPDTTASALIGYEAD